MNKSYDVYMCRNEQLLNDVMSIIGKGRQSMFSLKYKNALDQLSKSGYRTVIKFSGGDISATILNVSILRKAPIKGL